MTLPLEDCTATRFPAMGLAAALTLALIVRRPWDMSGRLKMYSGLTLNQYGVAAPSSKRTIL
ncbi:hypothetical protein HMPREF3156_00176 [Neisseria sp. HMSC06F02]|nr:hypothetical protein HMPREF3156_00176 [Neisseria sp. HMSC06F02]